MRKMFSLMSVCIVLTLSVSFAQSTASFSFGNDIVDYTQVFVIEVDDVPGHAIRIVEIEYDHTKNDNPPVFNGVTVNKIVLKIFTDQFNSTGRLEGYEQYQLENGDIIYGRLRGTSQTVFNDEGDVGKTSVLAVHELTGGTGAFEGIQGLLRSSLTLEPEADATFAYNETLVEGTYWMPDQVMGGQ